MTETYPIVIIGGGAAGIGAAHRLAESHVEHLIVEARTRLGGRGWTAEDAFPLDLGCGWLHSADINPWTQIAERGGFTIDRTPPPWTRPSTSIDLSLDDQRDFRQALRAFHERVDRAKDEPDQPASALLEPGGRWNALLDAVNTYVNGAETRLTSVRDIALYADTEANWRVAEGLGAVIAATGSRMKARLDCAVTEIDHSGKLIAVQSSRGTLWADAVIVTLPSAIIAEDRVRFTPALPAKVEAAAGLPLGLANKLFLTLDAPEEFDKDSRLFGNPSSVATAAYHMRPFGRPLIEAYFGGQLADDLEAEGGRAFVDFATKELTHLLGSDFASRINPLRLSQWRHDEFARGAYSYARPGRSGDRKRLAEPVDNRLFFAGEACSASSYSTAHGAWITGRQAAEQALASLRL